MTKKIIWRLQEQPSTESLRELVKDGILDIKEAREILFKETNEDENKGTEALKQEIKFLREMIDKLSNNQPYRIVETIREVEKPYFYESWYKPYEVWCSNDGIKFTTGTDSQRTSTGTSFVSLN